MLILMMKKINQISILKNQTMIIRREMREIEKERIRKIYMEILIKEKI